MVVLHPFCFAAAQYFKILTNPPVFQETKWLVMALWPSWKALRISHKSLRFDIEMTMPIMTDHKKLHWCLRPSHQNGTMLIAQQIKVLDAHFRLFKCFITGREIFDHAALKRDEGNITSLGEYRGICGYGGMGACSPGKLQKNEIAKSCIPIFWAKFPP